MRVLVLVAVLIAPAALAEPPRAPSPPSQLTLEDAIQLALTRNERAAIAELNVVVADAGVDEGARSRSCRCSPRTATTRYRPRDKPTGDDHAAALTFNQPLIAPSAFPLLRPGQAHARRRSSAQSDRRPRQLAFDAAQAYFNVLLADQVVQAAQKKLDTAKADVADTDAQVKAQLVSSNDVTRAQIGLASSAARARRRPGQPRGRVRPARVRDQRAGRRRR